MKYENINLDYIIDYCKDHDEVDWLKSTAAKTFKTKDGGKRKITFIEIKIAFAKKFMPDIIPKAKPKNPTMFEIIDAL